jgi:dihydroflavonol-4-reductase
MMMSRKTNNHSWLPPRKDAYGMKIFMVGGTGLLGSEAAKELIARGHEVTSIALPPLPTGAVLPEKMILHFGNYLSMSDDEIKAHMAGCEGFVFAAGVDERVEGPAPIFEMYRKFNIDPIHRLLRLAKESGVKHTVVLGSYFAYFNKIWPEKELVKWHPYMRSRRDQEEAALAYAGDGFDVAVLELPYIFGTQPGRKPVWLFLVEMIRGMKRVTLYPRGGTTMVTVRQVGQAVAGAIERNRGGNCYPIGYYNMTWKELLKIIHRYMGNPNKKIITIPNWMYTLGVRQIAKKLKARGIESGLDMIRYTEMQSAELFIDKSLGCEPLGVQPDDIDAAIGDSIRLCVDIMDRNVQTLNMKGE